MDFSSWSLLSIILVAIRLMRGNGYLADPSYWRALREDFGTENVSGLSYTVATPNMGPGVWGKIHGVYFVGFSGHRWNELGDTRTLVEHWESSASERYFDGGSPIMLQQARDNFPQDWFANPDTDFMRSPKVICGHSYGGCFATVFAAYLKREFPNGGPVRVVTMGAPKHRHIRHLYNFERPPEIRIIRQPDVVPQLPPYPTDIAQPLRFALRDRLDKWMDNIHPGIGTYVADGRPSEANQVGPNVSSFGFNVVAWLTEFLRGAEPTHGTTAYMDDWIDFQIDPMRAGAPQRMDLGPPAAGVAAGDNLIQDAAPFIRDVDAERTVLKAADYTPTDFVNRGTSRPGAARRIFNVQREGNLWWLTCLDERIAVYHRSRPAYDARNRGNALTRLLAGSDSVSRVATGEQMSRVISLVTAPESPFPRIPLAVD